MNTPTAGRADDGPVTRVLLIEDNPADALLTIEQLRRSAPDVRCHHVTRLAFATPELLADNDCVLLDLSLPDAQGLEALREVRHRNPDVPILVLTGLADLDVGVEALRHGAQDYLLKNSVDGPALERALRYAVERKRAQLALAKAALHDSLTGLFNRTGLNDRLSHALERRATPAQHTALLFCDLDHFKSINDSLGHLAGDELLQQVPDRVRPHLRPEDTLARLGGDEFVVLLEDLPDGATAERIAQRIVTAFGEPFRLDGQNMHVGISIGLALATPGSSAPVLMRDADTAMYVAKQAGRGRVATFTPGLHARAVENLTLENDLWVALQGKQMLLALQPLVGTTTGVPLFFEALSRWRHPLRGVLLPDSFLTVAQRSGAVEVLDTRALRNACALLAADASVPAIAVNLSPRSLALPDLPGTFAEVLLRSGVSASRLWVEVTEGALLDEVATRNVGELRDLGVRIALDDFGTGYSSLAYLARLRVDLIKIDKCFLPEEGDETATALLRAITQLGHAVGIPMALEGIERSDQLALATDLGLDFVQGFLLGRPELRAQPEDLGAQAGGSGDRAGHR